MVGLKLNLRISDKSKLYSENLVFSNKEINFKIKNVIVKILNFLPFLKIPVLYLFFIKISLFKNNLLAIPM